MNDLVAIESELKKRLTYPETAWGRPQSNDWDSQTRFIYDTPQWAQLMRLVSSKPNDLRNYSINRWFNHWHSKAVEEMFCSFPGVIAAGNPKDKSRDFKINGIWFDHKTTVFPKKYHQEINPDEYKAACFAYRNPGSLINWLYLNQSRQGRYHLKNRLFLVLFNRNGNSWKLRAELRLIYPAIKSYVENFDLKRLYHVNIDGNEALSDLIWIYPGKKQ